MEKVEERIKPNIVDFFKSIFGNNDSKISDSEIEEEVNRIRQISDGIVWKERAGTKKPTGTIPNIELSKEGTENHRINERGRER